MPILETTVPVDTTQMRFPQPRLDWRAALGRMEPNPNNAYLFILDEDENFLDERRKVLTMATELNITVRCGQNRVQTPPLDRQFYVVRTA